MAKAGNPVTLRDMREIEAAAGPLGLTVVTVEIWRMEDIAPGSRRLKLARICFARSVPKHVHRVWINIAAGRAVMDFCHSDNSTVETGAPDGKRPFVSRFALKCERGRD